MKSQHGRSDHETKDIKYVCRRLDEFYEAAVRNNYPYMTMEAEEVPPAMVVDLEDGGDVKWKMLPSTITERQICELESRLAQQLPPMYRAYPKSRFHLFEHLHPYHIVDEWNGPRKGCVAIATLPCDRPFWVFENANRPESNDFRSRFEHQLFAAGFILIGWNITERFALNTHSPNSEGDYEVVMLSQDLENDFYGKEPNSPLPFDLLDISSYMYTLCSSFREFVDLFIRYPAR